LNGNGGIVFGVSSYGGSTAPSAPPTFVSNPAESRPNTDIMTSPGGGFGTAPQIGTANIASTSPAAPLTVIASLPGGSNAFGTFGTGTVVNTGPQYGYTLTDSSPGGSGSYSVTTSVSNYTVTGGTANPGFSYGASLSYGGLLTSVGNLDEASLKVHLFDANPASFFNGSGAGVDLPSLVLALNRTSTTGYSSVTLGGTPTSAAILVDNASTGAFRGLAIDNLTIPTGQSVPGGDTVVITSTLTLFSDPAMMFAIDPLQNGDLLSLTGPLPDNLLVGSTSALLPEPASFLMFGTGVTCLIGCVVQQHRKRARTEA
jgi:hypothetical protein